MDRLFVPEIPVGFFQADLADGVVHTLAALWLAALPALDINAGQFVLVIDCEGNNARYRADGTDPTAAIGNRIIKDTGFVYTGTGRSNIKFIAETAANCKLNIGVYQQKV
jgi:hypothetical protein